MIGHFMTIMANNNSTKHGQTYISETVNVNDNLIPKIGCQLYLPYILSMICYIQYTLYASDLEMLVPLYDCVRIVLTGRKYVTVSIMLQSTKYCS